MYEKWVKIGKAIRGEEVKTGERSKKARKRKRNTNENSFTYKHNNDDEDGGGDAVNKEHSLFSNEMCVTFILQQPF